MEDRDKKKAAEVLKEIDSNLDTVEHTQKTCTGRGFGQNDNRHRDQALSQKHEYPG